MDSQMQDHCNVFFTIFFVCSTFPIRLNRQLGNNLLTGTIPVSLVSALPKVFALYFFQNKTQNLRCSPYTLVIRSLIHNNSISGTIPTEMGLMSSLAVFSAYDNQLSGTIPTEMASNEVLQNM